MLRGSLPGGRATISMPLSRISTFSSRTMSARPPPNRSRNSVWKWPLTVSSVSENSRRLSALIFSMIFSSEPSRRQVLVLVGERLVAGFELFEFIEGFEIHVAEVVDLLPQFLDLLLHLLAVVLLFVAWRLLQLGQFDAVVLAEAVGQAVALMADLVGGQFGGVRLLFELAARAAGLSNLLRAARCLRCCEALAPVDRGRRSGRRSLLAEIELGHLRLGPQDVPAGTSPARALGDLLAGLLGACRSSWFSSNCFKRAWRFRRRSSLLANSTLISVVSRSAAARRVSSCPRFVG